MSHSLLMYHRNHKAYHKVLLDCGENGKTIDTQSTLADLWHLLVLVKWLTPFFLPLLSPFPDSTLWPYFDVEREGKCFQIEKAAEVE